MGRPGGRARLALVRGRDFFCNPREVEEAARTRPPDSTGQCEVRSLHASVSSIWVQFADYRIEAGRRAPCGSSDLRRVNDAYAICAGCEASLLTVTKQKGSGDGAVAARGAHAVPTAPMAVGGCGSSCPRGRASATSASGWLRCAARRGTGIRSSPTRRRSGRRRRRGSANRRDQGAAQRGPGKDAAGASEAQGPYARGSSRARGRARSAVAPEGAQARRNPADALHRTPGRRSTASRASSLWLRKSHGRASTGAAATTAKEGSCSSR